jgi:hypothetical protein
MTTRMPDSDHRRLLQVAMSRADLTLEQLWMRYFALGGEVGMVEVEAYLEGLMDLPSLQHDILAHAINERLDELTPSRRAPYSRPVREVLPAHGPLRALVTLLEGMHLAAAETLRDVVSAAGRALGAEVTVYLVDYAQQTLIPLTGADGPHGVPLDVDATLAGRAFREVRTLASQAGGTPRLWLPLLDGVERLGVVEVVPERPVEPSDPLLHEQSRWLSYLIGHLVTAVTKYGDGLDSVRRTKPRTAAAELIWQLLPPPTAGVGAFTVSALLEPTDAIGGDAFDYALSNETAKLAIFDATGHSLASGVTTAAALAAYRSARRNGGGLYDQGQAIDAVIAENFAPSGRFVTGVLAEVDLHSGRLRYVVAGHPHPLIMRQGRVVKTLDGGGRPLFGLATAALTVGEEVLQRGDWLVLFTDGVVEARDPDGAEFGIARLVHFLEREAASGHPPPETVRRLVKAVMAYQQDVLQDDATVVLARWDGSRLSA